MVSHVSDTVMSLIILAPIIVFVLVAAAMLYVVLKYVWSMVTDGLASFGVIKGSSRFEMRRLSKFIHQYFSQIPNKESFSAFIRKLRDGKIEISVNFKTFSDAWSFHVIAQDIHEAVSRMHGKLLVGHVPAPRSMRTHLKWVKYPDQMHESGYEEILEARYG